jgi:hypothetical protein
MCTQRAYPCVFRECCGSVTCGDNEAVPRGVCDSSRLDIIVVVERMREREREFIRNDNAIGR